MGQQRFTPEFKDMAFGVAARLGVSSHSLYKWIRAVRPSKEEERSDDLVETKKEVLRLRSELRRVEEERDILKKAAAYFAKESE
jgi:transposase